MTFTYSINDSQQDSSSWHDTGTAEVVNGVTTSASGTASENDSTNSTDHQLNRNSGTYTSDDPDIFQPASSSLDLTSASMNSFTGQTIYTISLDDEEQPSTFSNVSFSSSINTSGSSDQELSLPSYSEVDFNSVSVPTKSESNSATYSYGTIGANKYQQSGTYNTSTDDGVTTTRDRSIDTSNDDYATTFSSYEISGSQSVFTVGPGTNHENMNDVKSQSYKSQDHEDDAGHAGTMKSVTSHVFNYEFHGTAPDLDSVQDSASNVNERSTTMAVYTSAGGTQVIQTQSTTQAMVVDSSATAPPPYYLGPSTSYGYSSLPYAGGAAQVTLSINEVSLSPRSSVFSQPVFNANNLVTDLGAALPWVAPAAAGATTPAIDSQALATRVQAGSAAIGNLANRASAGTANATQDACFVAGTLVETSKGHKPIEQIVPGDEVRSVDEHEPEGPTGFMPVDKVFHNPPARLLEVQLGDQSIRCTFDHRFYVRELGWTPAGDLRPDDRLRSPSGESTTVTGLVDTGQIELVYNLRVANHHTYFVVTPDRLRSLLVHNDYSAAAGGKLQQRGNQLFEGDHLVGTVDKNNVVRQIPGQGTYTRPYSEVEQHLGSWSRRPEGLEKDWNSFFFGGTKAGGRQGLRGGGGAPMGGYGATGAGKPQGETSQGYKSFRAFKKAHPNSEGKVWHHIVEQREANIEKFGAETIHNTANTVEVSPQVNKLIADYYAGNKSFTGGKTVRQWLNSQTFEEQLKFGRKILNAVLNGSPLPQ